MATLKDVKLKISAVKKTKQITKAMNMVAASKLRGTQAKMEAFRPYAGKFAEVLGSLSDKSAEEGGNPLLTPREKVSRVHLVLCTSDKGLCGGFNSALINKADSFIAEKAKNGIETVVTCFGKKGRDWARKSQKKIEDQYIGIVGGKFGFTIASKSGRKLIEEFLDGACDEVHIICSEFVTMARQIPVIKQLLPIPPIEAAEITDPDAPYLAEHICEPSSTELLTALLPKNVYVQLYSALIETSTSEHAARMTAMDNATKACNDMIGSLTLAYNKARQAAITAELMDIVGGAEALKG